MNDDGLDNPLEEVRNSQLLRAEYVLPSAKDEEWKATSRSGDQHLDERRSRRELERAIDPIELARTEELIARARFFTRVRTATGASSAVVGTTVRRVVPVVIGCAVVTLIGVSCLALLVIKRSEMRKASIEGHPFREPIQAFGLGLSRGLVQKLL